MKNLIIRKAQLADRPILLSLEQEVIEAERPYDSGIKSSGAIYYDLEHLLVNKDAHLIVAELNGQVIGTGYAKLRTSKESRCHSRDSYLGFMYVAPDHRGLGINKRIIDTLISWSKEQGVSDFYLDVYDENDAALRAYEKVGFVKTLVEMKLHL